ncbi:MAG: mannose-6-phosphate isomerase, partial [Roseiflexaceae bacterium]|nr:mannose-6-phosphate isomerase [Roseiflexaceae bacterium]
MTALEPLLLERKLDTRLWGGHTLGAWLRLEDAPVQLAESWQVYEHNRIASGTHAGRRLAEVAAEQGAQLVGTRSFA